MERTKPPWTDEKLERLLGNLLRIGVFLAAAVALGGGIIYLAHQGMHVPHYRVFQGEPTELKSVAGIIRDAEIEQVDRHALDREGGAGRGLRTSTFAATGTTADSFWRPSRGPTS